MTSLAFAGGGLPNGRGHSHLPAGYDKALTPISQAEQKGKKKAQSSLCCPALSHPLGGSGLSEEKRQAMPLQRLGQLGGQAEGREAQAPLEGLSRPPAPHKEPLCWLLPDALAPGLGPRDH